MGCCHQNPSPYSKVGASDAGFSDTRQHITAMSPPSLFPAPHIVELGLSANLAVPPVPAVPGVRASPPMHPTVQPNGHVCATYITVTGSPNFKLKLERSSLNVWLAWALAVGGPLLWGANHPEVPERESPWIFNCHATVIGDRDSEKVPGARQTTGGVSKLACLESRCR